MTQRGRLPEARRDRQINSFMTALNNLQDAILAANDPLLR